MKRLMLLALGTLVSIALTMPAWSQNTTGNTTSNQSKTQKETKAEKKAKKNAAKAQKKADKDAKTQQNGTNKK